MVLNADFIVTVEQVPDTTVVLSTGQRLMIQEAPEEVIEKVVEYRRSIQNRPVQHAGLPAQSDPGHIIIEAEED
tara:strand:- start:2012 stop:2233 length:222 start_codon:yes stop_codon:yes gene_type:complete